MLELTVSSREPSALLLFLKEWKFEDLQDCTESATYVLRVDNDSAGQPFTREGCPEHSSGSHGYHGPGSQ